MVAQLLSILTTIVQTVASRISIEAVIGAMTSRPKDSEDEPDYVDVIWSFIINPRVQARIDEWDRRQPSRVRCHLEMVDTYCQNKKQRPRFNMLEESRSDYIPPGQHLTNRDRFWEGDDKFTCLTASLILALPFQPHVLLCEFLKWKLNVVARRRPVRQPACSLDLKGEGRHMSGAMDGPSILQFRAGTLPPLDYGYDEYVGSLPRNWDRPHVGSEPLYDSEGNLLNGSDDDDRD
jgi:hypothetical protein